MRPRCRHAAGGLMGVSQPGSRFSVQGNEPLSRPWRRGAGHAESAEKTTGGKYPFQYDQWAHIVLTLSAVVTEIDIQWRRRRRQVVCD